MHSLKIIKPKFIEIGVGDYFEANTRFIYERFYPKGLIIDCEKNLKNKNLNTVVPVIAFSYPIQRAFKAEKGILKLREPKHINTRSQDLETHYHDSGQFYWLNVEDFLNEKTIFSNKTGFIELKEHEAQDVDTLEDWQKLNIKYNYKNLHNEKNV